MCNLEGRYENPIPTRFLASIDCIKIPALVSFSAADMRIQMGKLAVDYISR
jgi:hypothetical protein